MQNALTEARIMASLIHPNIIKFKEVIIDNKKLCLVQEYTNYLNVEQLKNCKNKQNKRQEIKKTDNFHHYFAEEVVWKVLI